MKRYLNRLFQFPLFPFLTAVFLILHMELQFGELYTYGVVLRPVLFILLAPVVLYFLLFPVFKNRNKTALITFAVSFVLFFGSEIKYYFMSVFPGNLLGKYSFLLPAFLLFLILIFYFVYKSGKSFQQLVRYLNIIFLIFIGYDIVQIALKNVTPLDYRTQTDRFAPYCDTCTYPNIYYIVLDGYSSGKLLQSAFGFDNSAMENELAAKQFRVLPDSKSNYNITSYSIASTFNMRYSMEIDKDVFLLKDYTNGVREIYHNQLFPLLIQTGYTTSNLSFFSIKDTPKESPAFDIFNMEHLFNKYNLFYQVYQDLDLHFLDWLWNSDKEMEKFIRDKDNYNPALFSMLKEKIAVETVKPKFTYVHYYTPHAPYTRDSLGNRVIRAKADSLSETKQYIAQIQYTNRFVMENISHILEKDKKEKIIIIQADHGFRFDLPNRYAEEFPNFCAVYFTRNDLLHSLPADLNNVNTFLYIRNLLFNTKMSILEPKQFALKYKTKGFH